MDIRMNPSFCLKNLFAFFFGEWLENGKNVTAVGKMRTKGGGSGTIFLKVTVVQGGLLGYESQINFPLVQFMEEEGSTIQDPLTTARHFQALTDGVALLARGKMRVRKCSAYYVVYNMKTLDLHFLRLQGPLWSLCLPFCVGQNTVLHLAIPG